MNLVGKRFENSRLNMEVYVYEIDGKEWFIGKDIAELLNYSDTSQAIKKNVSEKCKIKKYVKTVEIIGNSPIDVSNNLILINESGLYQLALRSRKVEAVAFQIWICEEVLPSIRKNNFYVDKDYVTKEQYTKLKNMLLLFCENGKIGLPTASDLIFGNKKELNKRLIKLGFINRETCWYMEDFTVKDKDSGVAYPVFVCDTKGDYKKGEVSKTLQVSLTNHGFVYFKQEFLDNPNAGL